MTRHVRTLRIPADLDHFLVQEAKRITLQKGYRKSVNHLLVDLVNHAMLSKPKDRPWNW